MKTAQETAHIMEGLTHIIPKYNGTPRDEYRVGLRQALQDFVFENKMLDRFALATHHSSHFAEGYTDGKAIACARYAELQTRKGFPGDKGFNATAHYGRAH